MSLRRERLDRIALRIPAEWESHACCWMAWAVQREWGRATNAVKSELSQIIHEIARHEPVCLLAAAGEQYSEAVAEFSGCTNVTVLTAPVDDIWMRDIAPTFAIRRNREADEVVAIDWNFNSWGGTKERKPRRGDALATSAASVFGAPIISASFIAEGGAFACDGQGTIITTKSCLLNPNRNGPDVQSHVESELIELGARNVIWLTGDPDEPITSGHVDGYVLPAPNGMVLFDVGENAEIRRQRRRDIAVLQDACNSDGSVRHLRLVYPPRLDRRSALFAACYLNAYVTNGAVITGRFGDLERDEAAAAALAEAFPGREIVMLRIDSIASGGGGVHCLTQPMPTLSNL